MSSPRRSVVSILSIVLVSGFVWLGAKAEISIRDSSNEPQLIHILGKQDDPIPLPHFAQVANPPPGTILNPTGDGNGDIAADLVGRPGGPWAVAWSYWDGSDYEIAYSEWNGSQWTAMLLLTDNGDDDLDVSITLDASGRPLIAYWRDETTPSVYQRRRFTNATWETECLVSNGSDAARHPKATIGVDGRPRISYDLTVGAQREIRVAWDDRLFPQELPNFVQDLVGQTAFTESTRPEVKRRAGHVWVSWIHDGAQVGWSELAPDGQGGFTWTAPAFEPYAGPGDIEAARFRIQRQIAH